MLRLVPRPFALLCLALIALPAHSSEPPLIPAPQFVQHDPSQFTYDDMALIQSIMEKTLGRRSDDQLATLDMLERDAARTDRQRVILRSFRALIHLDKEEPASAIRIARETATSWPNDPLAHSSLAQVAYVTHDIPLAARAMIDSVRLDPAMANRYSAYEQRVLFDQLAMMGREDLSIALSRQLFDAGWESGSLGLRSQLALGVVRDLLLKKDLPSARRYVMEIRSPSVVAELLADDRYRLLHPSIEAWAGPRLGKQWEPYLKEARSRFNRVGDATAAWEYSAALSTAGHHRTVVDAMLPLAERSYGETEDEEWIFSIAKAAESLAVLGRWEEAFALLGRATSKTPTDSQNRINLTANHARLKLMRGDFDAASRMFGQVLDEAKGNPAVGSTVAATLRSYQICADHMNGKAVAADAERVALDMSALEPIAVTRMWLCLGKPDRARTTWTIAQSEADGPYELLEFMQPSPGLEYPSKFARDLDAEYDLLRRDSRLRRMAERVGSIRSWRVRASAPKEQVYSR